MIPRQTKINILNNLQTNATLAGCQAVGRRTLTLEFALMSSSIKYLWSQAIHKNKSYTDDLVPITNTFPNSVFSIKVKKTNPVSCEELELEWNTAIGAVLHPAPLSLTSRKAPALLPFSGKSGWRGCIYNQRLQPLAFKASACSSVWAPQLPQKERAAS